jgi:bacterioferritin
MKGKPEVVAVLAEMLAEEMCALNQYMLHAEMCENWGYKKLASMTKKQSIGEMKHAEQIIERILFLEGMPQMDKMSTLKIGTTVKDQLKNDLALERGAVVSYNRAIELCRKVGDNATADFFTVILQDEESHVDALEQQLGLVEQLGLENYLAQQLAG